VILALLTLLFAGFGLYHDLGVLASDFPQSSGSPSDPILRYAMSAWEHPQDIAAAEVRRGDLDDLHTLREAAAGVRSARWVRPGEPGWPTAAEWAALGESVGGRLVQVESAFAVCQPDAGSAACTGLFQKNLLDPFYIDQSVNLTQTLGWLDAFTSEPSAYAVLAASSADVAAAVNFAREHNVRLVVKSGGHSYLGTSNAADSLLIWTRPNMQAIEVLDSFVPQGGAGLVAPEPAVSVGAGCIWMDAYNAVTTVAGRYVWGGGCTTVGVSGLTQGGGFGSFSKEFGTAASNLLEAEVVTADGTVRVVNAFQDPDLFWRSRAVEAGPSASSPGSRCAPIRCRTISAWWPLRSPPSQTPPTRRWSGR
jgi:hypothetical protein